jgi:hypothetical protein
MKISGKISNKPVIEGVMGLGVLELHNSKWSLAEGLLAAIDKEWKRISEPGTWWTASERVAIAEEVRKVKECELCARKKAALSPFSIKENHKEHDFLTAEVIEVVHRVVSDNGRLTEHWLNEVFNEGLPPHHYVEVIGVIATVITVDTFLDTLSLERLPFYPPQEGEPTQLLPEGAIVHSAWVSTVQPELATDPVIKDFYETMKKRSGFVANIMRAMTLVPTEQLGFCSLMVVMYHTDLTLSKSQVELLATTVSDFNDCFY